MYREMYQTQHAPQSKTDQTSFARTEEILRLAKKGARRHSFHFGGGAALVLIVLIIISLLCFAALCVISARADAKLTDRYEEEVSSYYRARNLGTEFIAQTTADLQELYADAMDTSSTDSAAAAAGSDSSDAAGKIAYYAAARDLEGCVDPSDEESVWHDELHRLLISTGYQKEAENTPVLVFSAPVNDHEVYWVAALVHYPDADDPAVLHILASKTVSTVIYDYDTTLNVMKRS